MSAFDMPRHLPDPEAESTHTFTTKAQAREYVRNVVAAMIDNEVLHYGHSAEGWFLGDVHDTRTRELITAAALELKAKLLK